MLFMRAGTLRAALTLAREEGMLDGQDPTVVMNKCSEVQLDATVELALELCARGSSALSIALSKDDARRVIVPTLEWPVVLKMYVSVHSLPVRCEAGKWPSYLVARRMPTQKVHEVLSRLLGKLSDRGLKYAVKVVPGEDQAR
jgi:hypothetical protein